MADLGSVGQDGNLVGPSVPFPNPFTNGGGFDGNMVGYGLRGGIVIESAGGTDAQDATVAYGTSVSESATSGSVDESAIGSAVQDAVMGYSVSVGESATGTDDQDATVITPSVGRSFVWIIG